jgi:hypothetical protein
MKLSHSLLKTLVRFLQDHPGIAQSVAEAVVQLRPELQAQLGGGSALPPAAIEKIAAMKRELGADLDAIRKADAQRLQLARATAAQHTNGHLREAPQ